MPVAMASTLGSKMISSGGKFATLGEKVVGPLADAYFSFVGIGLSLLIKRHHHGGRSIGMYLSCFFYEFFLTLFQ